MSELIIITNSACETKQILDAVYDADPAVAFFSTKSVTGSVLTAIARDGYVEITSTYYAEDILLEMFSQFI